MEKRFILGQQALTPDGAVYQIIWDEPYNESITPDAVVQELPNRAPENTVAGSTCIYNTEDADGYPVEWLFAFDGTNWALERVVRGGSAGGGGGDFTTASVTITNNSTQTFTLSIPYLSEFDDRITSSLSSFQMDGSAFPVVLYKGKTDADPSSGNVRISATGDITIVRGVITISGDGSITFSDKG